MSDSESSDADLIREILDLRPDHQSDQSNTAEDHQEEAHDPFAVDEPITDPGPAVSKKRTRRLDDSNDDEEMEVQSQRRKGRIRVLSDHDDDDDPIAASFEPVDPSTVDQEPTNATDMNDDLVNDDDDDVIQDSAPSSLSKLNQIRPAISESDADENHDANIGIKPKSNQPTPRRKLVKKRPVISDESDQDESKNNRPLLKSLKSNKLETKRTPYVFSDESDSDQMSRDDGNDPKKPVVSDSSDDGGPESVDKRKRIKGQSRNPRSSKPQPKKKQKPVNRSLEPSNVSSDTDDSDLDKVILKKHCTVAGRRQKYATKPNPGFLDMLLNNIAQRSLHLRLRSQSSNTDQNTRTGPVTSNHDHRSDNDSIELEFSDDEECKMYGEQFKKGLYRDRPFEPTVQDIRPKPAIQNARPAVVKNNSPPSTKPSQKLKVRTQSVCGLYQNVGGQSARQTILKGLKKESRIRRMNSLCRDNVDSMS